jgi:hypothetical protein
METMDQQTLDSLNALLEDERASVGMEIALANGATELREHEIFAAMGAQEIGFCCELHEHLAQLGALVTPHISGMLFHVLDTERYDDRLLAFAQHQRGVAEQVRVALLTATGDQAVRALLQEIEEAHFSAALWCERRATEFAATRDLDFRIPHQSAWPAAHLAGGEQQAVSGPGTEEAERGGEEPHDSRLPGSASDEG